MPPVANLPMGGQHGPSNFDKCKVTAAILSWDRVLMNSTVKMGAMMGGTVGVIIGFIYVSIFRYGAGSQGVFRTLGQFMGASGATFGVIRSDADPKLREAYMRAHRRPIIMMASPAWRKSS
ncbi:mitochondrial genome maintenance protein Mgr2 [Cordyceps militaris CM01]|uniref:Mitochondrial genome maintenance protein Mgr2 n=1 Tax=Cordyceps militaris (strain CM01) TaxID=983644 RepID=G3JIP2_CORMM|nr:mitochondrial genome maintenance protein Mgr2 [Cordyceps militaris CM01]EGX91091.1 mitochondrial genome maintenance protein Mgr2 [Cordyceps militaris CM01]